MKPSTTVTKVDTSPAILTSEKRLDKNKLWLSAWK
jgi:hypothetical protein